MENHDLLFFCTMCRDKSAQEISEIKCTIAHTIKPFKRGDHIAWQGDKVSHLCMLTKGKVKTEVVSDTGFTLAMEEIKAPFPLAAAFLFADNNRFPVDVIALEECEILFIKKEAVEKQIAKCPGFLRGFMAFNANRIQYLSERMKIFAQKGIKAKIAYYILQRTKGQAFELGRSMTSLAEYFAIERPSLSRAFSEMVRDGIIEFESGQGKIINGKALERLLE